MIKEIKLYKGNFNWHGERIELYSKCTSAKRAKENFISQLNTKLNISKWALRNYFNPIDRDNYTITLIKEKKETCFSCSGTGLLTTFHYDDYTPCMNCNGTGRLKFKKRRLND